MEIRAADAEDWPRIFPFYSAIVEAGETHAFPLGQSLEQARPSWMEQPPGITVVAVDGADVLCSAKMGSNRPRRGAHVAIASFMFNPAHQGRGVGKALAEYTLAWARSAGYASMQLNAVVETNAAAIGLWKALGFAVIGNVPEAFDHPRHGRGGLHAMYLRL